MTRIKAQMSNVGPNGNLYVTDTEGRVYMLDTTNDIWCEIPLPEHTALDENSPGPTLQQ